MNDLNTDNLSVDDLQKVENLIAKLSKKKETTKPKFKSKSRSKKKQTKPSKSRQNSEIEKVGTAQNPRKISSRKPQISTHLEGRTLTPAQQKVKDNEEGVGNTACRMQPITIGPRENKFLKSADYNSCKEDTQFDKLMHQKVTEDGEVIINPIPERREAVEYVTIDCYKCGRSFVTTSNNVVQIGNEYKSECNRCSSVKE